LSGLKYSYDIVLSSDLLVIQLTRGVTVCRLFSFSVKIVIFLKPFRISH